jgi:hypothetical protein
MKEIWIDFIWRQQVKSGLQYLLFQKILKTKVFQN